MIGLWLCEDGKQRVYPRFDRPFANQLRAEPVNRVHVRLFELFERLVESGHLDRRTSDADRRVQVIRLTKIGRAEFRKMAAEHETWISDIFADLSPKDVRELMRLLAKTKSSAQKSATARAL